MIDYFLSNDLAYTKLNDDARITILRKFALINYTGRVLPPGAIVGPPVPNSDLPPAYKSRPLMPPIEINPEDFQPDVTANFDASKWRVVPQDQIQFEAPIYHTPNALAANLCDPDGIDATLQAQEAEPEEARVRTWDSDRWWYFGVIVLITAIPRVWYLLLARLQEVASALRGRDE